jgi:hypothetical protein
LDELEENESIRKCVKGKMALNGYWIKGDAGGDCSGETTNIEKEEKSS